MGERGRTHDEAQGIRPRRRGLMAVDDLRMTDLMTGRSRRRPRSRSGTAQDDPGRRYR